MNWSGLQSIRHKAVHDIEITLVVSLIKWIAEQSNNDITFHR